MSSSKPSIEAISETMAKADAISQTVIWFEDEINEGFENISYSVLRCYETTSDARPN